MGQGRNISIWVWNLRCVFRGSPVGWCLVRFATSTGSKFPNGFVALMTWGEKIVLSGSEDAGTSATTRTMEKDRKTMKKQWATIVISSVSMCFSDVGRSHDANATLSGAGCMGDPFHDKPFLSTMLTEPGIMWCKGWCHCQHQGRD